MKITIINSVALSSVLILGACTTLPKSNDTGVNGGIERNTGPIDPSFLNQTPASVAAAVKGGNIVLDDYNSSLKSADRNRRIFNVLGIISGAYTGIGAGIRTAPSNLVFSTALSGALPLLEPNVQTHGSPETIGEAIMKTSCIIRQAQEATTSDVLLNVALLRSELETQASGQTDLVQTLSSYDALASRIVDSYMSVYYNYSVNKIPPLLSKEEITKALTSTTEAENEANGDAQIQTEADASETAEVENLVGSPQPSEPTIIIDAQGNKLFDRSPAPWITFGQNKAEEKLAALKNKKAERVAKQIGIVSQATKTAEKQIADCVAAPTPVAS